MKVTKNLKRRLEKAKQEGFKRVYVVLGNKFATTYCSVVDIDTLLDWPTGTHYWMPRPTKIRGGRRRKVREMYNLWARNSTR